MRDTMDEKDPRAITILLAEDDEDDHFLILEAMHESKLANDIRWVRNGEELLSYLRREGRYSPPDQSPTPGLILLDLNMPRMDGREALKEIKSDPALRKIPIVVLTTSRSDEDVLRSYDLGVNSFVRKPVQFSELVEVIKIIGKYWLQIVMLPTEAGR